VSDNLVRVGPAEYVNPDAIIAIRPNVSGATIIDLRGAPCVISTWSIENVIEIIRASREDKP
jgi:hypothetical protein